MIGMFGESKAVSPATDASGANAELGDVSEKPFVLAQFASRPERTMVVQADGKAGTDVPSKFSPKVVPPITAPRRMVNGTEPRFAAPSWSWRVAVRLSPQPPLAVKLNGRVTAPPAESAPYVCAPLGEATPPVARRVATRFVVSAEPALIKLNLMVTASLGSTALFVQVSSTSARLFETICGAGAPARALIRALPVGVPHPVHKSKPDTAENLVGLDLFVLLPVTMSWNDVA